MKILTPDAVSIGEFYYNAAGPACLVPSTDIRKSGANKHEQSVPKDGTKS